MRIPINALVFDISDVRLWGLDAGRRLRRQLAEIGKTRGDGPGFVSWAADAGDLPASGPVLLFNGGYVFEIRTIAGLLDRPGSILKYDGKAAAAFVDAGRAREVIGYMREDAGALPAGLTAIATSDLASFDTNLRRATKPLLEPVSADRKSRLENKLYGNAYRGITDLVTKFIWPRPAKQAVRACASLGITPNMVTTFGLLLVIAACFLFYHRHYGWGLLAGWIMTYLDTVDGKLARVTVNSSKFGHLYDHLIDLLHPPFWYILWGVSLTGFNGAFGLDVSQMSWAIVMAYVSGRIVEGLFPLLGKCEIFTWRPFDAWFRLVTARRNPCLILMTLSWLAGRPDWGFIAVTFWTVLTTIILNLRLAYAAVYRLKNGPLDSWLSEDDVASGPNARSYAIFGATTVSSE